MKAKERGSPPEGLQGKDVAFHGVPPRLPLPKLGLNRMGQMTEAEIVEIIVMSAYAVYANDIADGAVNHLSVPIATV
jgi:hypothetical protein